MTLNISRVQIKNFRNFNNLDVSLNNKAVIVGENKSGKTNFIYALRLLLDPSLPDSYRQLKVEDFWDGLESPMENGDEITISIDFQGFEDNEALLAILSDYLIKGEDFPTSRITYKFAPMPIFGDVTKTENIYNFIIYGGDDLNNIFGYNQRKWIPLQVLPALRDAETDLESWRRSPLRPLVERLNVLKEDLESAASKVTEGTEELLKLEEVHTLSADIEHRLENMIGKFYSVSPSLGIISTDAFRLLRSLRLFVDGIQKRVISDASLGICNILYLVLLLIELERKETSGEIASTILAIEEPEAHLHPHLQRLVYHDFLRRESSVLLTTHSPQIVSVSPISSLVILKDYGNKIGSKATSTTKLDITKEQLQDLERYLDTTRGEILFARGVILVEGLAELYIIPAFAEALEIPLDQRGISVCSVHGTDFIPYVRLLGKEALNIPFVILTDGDPFIYRDETYYRGYQRNIKIMELIKSDVAKSLLELFKNKQWNEVNKILSESGIFVGKNCLEIDLACFGYINEMIDTLKELGAGQDLQDKFKTTLSNYNNFSDVDVLKILEIIKRYGKGRYAQRLSPKLKGTMVPDYIKSALKYIVNLLD